MTNWRTSVFGTLTLLAAFFTQFPEQLDFILDPALAKKIAVGCALFTGFLTFANSKDRQVSGNGTFAAPTIVATGDGTSRHVLPVLLAAMGLSALGVACALVLVMLTGCASGSGPTPEQLAAYEKLIHAAVQDGVQDVKTIKPLLNQADPRPPVPWAMFAGGDEAPDWIAKERFDAWQGRADYRASLHLRQLFGPAQP